MYIPKFFTHPSSVYYQHKKIGQLQRMGYSFNKGLTAAYSAVVLNKGTDVWVFGLDGSIAHNLRANVRTCGADGDASSVAWDVSDSSNLL